MITPAMPVKNSFLHYSEVVIPRRRAKSETFVDAPLEPYDANSVFEKVFPELNHESAIDQRRSLWSSCTGAPKRCTNTTLARTDDRGSSPVDSITTKNATGDDIPCLLRHRYLPCDSVFGGCRGASQISTPVSRDTRATCSMSSRLSIGDFHMPSTDTEEYCRSASPDEFQDWQTMSTLNPSDHQARPSPEEFALKFGHKFIEDWYQHRKDQGILPDTYAFHAVLAANALKGDVKRCSDWFNHMRQSPSAVMDVQSYVHVLQACGKAGDSESAFTWFDFLRDFMCGAEAPTRAYNAVIEACGKDSKPEVAESWFALLQTRRACDASSYNYIALAWALAGNVSKAEKWYQQMLDDGFTATAESYNALLCAHERRPDVAKAEAIFRLVLEMEDGPTLDSWNYMMSIYSKRSDIDKMESLFQDMCNYIEPDSTTLCHILTCCAKKGYGDRAVQWFKQIEWVSPESYEAYSLVIEALSKQGDVKNAMAWFRELVALGIHIPDISCYNSILSAMIKDGELTDAQELLREIAGQPNIPNPDASSYNMLLEAYCKRDNGNVQSFLEDFQIPLFDTTTVNIIMTFFSKKGDIDMVEHWFQRMEQMDLKPDTMTYNVLLDACAKRGDLARAEMWLKRLKGSPHQPSLISYTSVISASAKRGDLAKTEYWFRRLLAAKIEPDAASFNAVIAAFARKGDVEKSEEWFAKLGRNGNGLRPNTATYNIMVDACAKQGDADRAEWWFHELERIGLQPDLTTYNSLICAFARGENIEKAKLWLGRMIDVSNLQPDVVSYNCVIDACGRAADADQAYAWLQRMASHCNPDKVSYNSLLSAYARVGDFAAAERAFYEMERSNIEADEVSYLLMISFAARNEGIKVTEYWYRKMCEAKIIPNRKHFNAVINSCVTSGNIAKAEEWINRMEAMGEKPDQVTLSTFLNVCLRAKNANKADHLFRRIRQCCEMEAKHYSLLLKVCTQCCDAEKVEFWKREMHKLGFSIDKRVQRNGWHKKGGQKPMRWVRGAR